MCKPQGRCGKDHFAAESGGRYRTVAREKGMYHLSKPKYYPNLTFYYIEYQ